MGTTSVCVAGVLLHRDGQVLLQHRDPNPAIRYPGHWAIFGGALEPGETAETAARREIFEELGLRLTGPLELVYVGDDGQLHRTFYAAPLDRPVESLDLQEGQGMGLFTPELLDLHPVVPLHREVVRTFLVQLAARAAS